MSDRLKLFFFVITLIWTSQSWCNDPASTQIIETNSFLLPFRDLSDGTIVVVDLDNTIFESAHMLGSNQWLEFAAKTLVEHGTIPGEAFQDAAGIWEKLQASIRVRPVHEEGPPLIREAQKRKVLVLGLTVRRPSLAKITRRQLRSVGVDFSKAKFPVKELNLNVDTHDEYRVLFEKGIIFNGPRSNKGASLYEFLKRANLLDGVRKIHFIDDKAKNVKHVVDFFTEVNKTAPRAIEVVGFRYGGADNRVNNFDPKIADFQLRFWRESGTVLPDEFARALLAHKCDSILGLLRT